MPRTAYYLARRVMTQRRRDQVKAGLARGRKKLWPLIRAWNGRFDSTALRDELARALPAKFDVLMVHCSYDDLLPMYSEGVAELLGALRAVCGPTRTLAMPAFTFGVPGGDLAAHYAARPRFDARRQPSQMGLLSEVFRRTPGVVRSLHPTHSVCALGPVAPALTAEHHLAGTTFGPRTPFARMAEMDTVILGLGKPYYRVLTQVHAAEDLLGDAFPVARQFREVDMVLFDGTDGHPYRFRAEVSPPHPRVDRLAALLAPGEIDEWDFHGVPLFWTRAESVTRAVVEAARQGRTLYPGPTLA